MLGERMISHVRFKKADFNDHVNYLNDKTETLLKDLFQLVINQLMK